MLLPLLNFILFMMLWVQVTSAAASPVVLDIKEFGAVGDGQANDYVAFERALERADSFGGKPVIINVRRGTYRIEPRKTTNISSHLEIQGLRNLQLIGEAGTELVFSSPFHHGISIRGSDNIRIKDIALDYDPLPFTQGVVISASTLRKTIDFELDRGYPDPTTPHIAGGSLPDTKLRAYIYDSNTGLKLNRFYDKYLSRIDKLKSGRTYRIHSKGLVEQEIVGSKIVVLGRRKVNAVDVRKSFNVNFERISIYSAPASGFNISTSEKVVVRSSKLLPKPGTSRFISTNADGIHSKWCKNGPEILDSLFSTMGDDAINIGGSYVRIIKVVNQSELLVEKHGSLYVNPPELAYLNLETHEHVRLPSVKEIKDERTTTGVRLVSISFNDYLPTYVTRFADGHSRLMLINMNATGERAKIIGNSFFNHRGRSILARGNKIRIENNLFDSILGPAIVVSNDSGFINEGPSGNSVSIVGNQFRNVERSNIWVDSSVHKEKNNAGVGVKHLQITGNVFNAYGGEKSPYGRGVVGNVLFINNASDVTFKNNEINDRVKGSTIAPIFIIGNTRRLTIEANSIAETGEGLLKWKGNVEYWREGKIDRLGDWIKSLIPVFQ